MLTPDLVLRNGRVVSEDGVIAADLAIVGDRIEAIGDGIPSGEREIDAGGKYVFPGGVDPHCHLAQVSGAGVPTADDFASGTRSAAFGGTTTVMAFAAQHRGTTVLDAIAEAMRRAEAEAMVDYGLHLIPTELHDHTAADLAEVARLGITSMKVFMTYERLRLAGSDLVEVLAAARGVGMTVMVHAEHDGLISWTRHRLVAQGRRDAMAHAEAHSRVAERAGVAEIVAIAEALEIGIYLVHLSHRIRDRRGPKRRVREACALPSKPALTIWYSMSPVSMGLSARPPRSCAVRRYERPTTGVRCGGRSGPGRSTRSDPIMPPTASTAESFPTATRQSSTRWRTGYRGLNCACRCSSPKGSQLGGSRSPSSYGW